MDKITEYAKILAKRFDALGELSDSQHLELVNYRGGCACSWPTISAPCSRCTGELMASEAEALGWLDDEIEFPSLLQLQGKVCDTDRPGIAAMAAKNAAPTPEPVLSIGEEQVSEREIAEALKAYRAKYAPPVKETPQRLMTVRAFDHRLGLWNGEGC